MPNTEIVLERTNAVSTLAKNLMLARTARNITQDKLADDSGISRATIAQIESGESDPRLSTMVELATALDISVLLLLMGKSELSAIADLMQSKSNINKISGSISAADLLRIEHHIQSGVPKGQKRAALIGAGIATAAGFSTSSSVVGAAIGTLLFPGIGTAIGAALGGLIVKKAARRSNQK